MNNLISKKEVVKFLEEQLEKTDDTSVLCQIQATLCHIETLDACSGWVSVKDKLPSKPEFIQKGYIVQADDIIEPFSAYWDGGMWYDEQDIAIDNVIAWMELPEQYRE